MSKYAKEIASAIKDIQKNGCQVTWRSFTVVSDPDEPWKEAETTYVEHTPYVLFVPSSSSITRLAQLFGDTDIVFGDEAGYMANVTFEPSLKDLVVKPDGTIYKVKSINKIDPDNGGAILYILEFVK